MVCQLMMYSNVIVGIITISHGSLILCSVSLLLTRTKICGLTERDYGPIRAIMLFLGRELSKTKQDKDFVSLV